VIQNILIGLFVFLIAVALTIRGQYHKDKDNLTPSPPKKNSGKRIRLTEQQIIALSCASYVIPIYGETPSFVHAQMPDNAHCFNIRTIESLVKRGYLKSNLKGGFLLTIEGYEGRQSAMGF
jgi:hypothetical protein